MGDWRDFWNGEHSIYANARHKLLHNARNAQDMAGLIETPQSQVLDYGCGDMNAADIVARRCARLYLFDQAKAVQAKLRGRFGTSDSIIVLPSEGLESLPAASLDLIIVHSVLQYMSFAECESLLARLHGKLKASGRLVIGDLIQPGNSPLDDARALLRFALQGGFFIAACAGLVRTVFSQYTTLRKEIGLTCYAPEDIATLLAANGFTSKPMARNIGMNQARFCVEARLKTVA
ncbi:MAG: methyltransferase domain-containing protein [Hyphomicrobiales bacterium]|nr:methyltransferase domain-containing protein [Hyphomicrobiales bacterium]MDE2115133.1 methyltransferase domain-containing protein [Hyphomicrobiales bacterium]